MPAAEMHDLVIVGAGPAGSAAAIRARQLGRSVLLIERSDFPRGRTCSGWIGPAGVALAQECGLTARSVRAAEFRGLTLHSWDCRKQTPLKDDELQGWLVRRESFDAALLKKAAAGGASVRHGVWPVGLRSGEDHVQLALNNGAQVAARIVIIADGSASHTAALAQLGPTGQQRAAVCWLRFVARKEKPAIEVAVGHGRAPQLVTITRHGDETLVMLLTRDFSTPPRAQADEFVQHAQARGIIPAGSPSAASECASVAGAALDMDRHVGKRCLLAGEAGGFVAAFTNEGIYPALRSGWLAAEAGDRALATRLPQDELTHFSGAWRAVLADYLRMPNTDLSLLVPLVFNNIQMARRVGRAFLLGQGF